MDDYGNQIDELRGGMEHICSELDRSAEVLFLESLPPDSRWAKFLEEDSELARRIKSRGYLASGRVDNPRSVHYRDGMPGTNQYELNTVLESADLGLDPHGTLRSTKIMVDVTVTMKLHVGLMPGEVEAEIVGTGAPWDARAVERIERVLDEMGIPAKVLTP